MNNRVRAIAAVLGTVALVVTGTAVFAATTDTPTATCTHYPKIGTTKDGRQKISMVCKLPMPPASTVTATTTATATATVTVTASPSPSQSSTPTPSSTTSSPALSGSLYEPGSYLYSAPGSIDQGATTAMRDFLHTFAAQAGTDYPLLRGVGSNKWGMVYAEGTASDPVWRLTGSVPSAVAQQLSVDGFHAPAWLGDVLTGTTDSPFVVVDHATGISLWGAKASKGTGYTINVGAAGYFEHASNGLDKRRPESDSTVNLMSRGRIPDTMVVTRAQMDAAVADHTDLGHVLEIFWAETDSTAGYKFPMTGAEGNKSGWGAEGQRIAIDPAVDLASRDCSPQALVIALTLQRHGAYLGDNSGGGAALKMEQENSSHPVWNGTVSADELAGCVTWDDFIATTN
jgi:hypothetical protein